MPHGICNSGIPDLVVCHGDLIQRSLNGSTHSHQLSIILLRGQSSHLILRLLVLVLLLLLLLLLDLLILVLLLTLDE